MNNKNDTVLYHYCSNEVMYSIINNMQLWMTDISRSNDYNEMRIFLPGIFYAIENEYKTKPYNFVYDNKEGLEAIQALLKHISKYISESQENGFLTSFVICFSENGDVLSQWRGYANNGKGCSIGFSLVELQEYCKKYKGLMEILPVQYVDRETIKKIANEEAKTIVREIQDLPTDAEHLLELSTRKDKNINSAIFALAIRLFEKIIYKSLQYKYDSFSEEKEWRMFFNSVSKDEKYLFADEQKVPEWMRNINKEWDVFHGKICFYPKEDCLLPYYPVDIKELSGDSIKEIIIGPKNKTYIQDIKLLQAKAGISPSKISYSIIAYR